jgi:hypothetical protein
VVVRVIVHRRDRRERGEFLFPVTPDSDPESRISPQMTQIAQIRRPKNGFICDISGSFFKQFSWEGELSTNDADEWSAATFL